MKVAICTIFDKFPNYGNKLQNYALTYFLKKNNIDYSSMISNKTKFNFGLETKILIKRVIELKLQNYILDYKKKKKFNDFNKKYLNPNYDFVKNKISSDDFDYFIVGSDQVWNDNWFDGYREKLFLLTFVEDKKKICYAPSFGVSNISAKWENYFKEYLIKFKNISVREQEGAAIVKRLINKDVEVLIDPTLLLTREEWRAISKPVHFKKKNLKKRYILKYFLGSQQEDNVKKIDQLAKKYDLSVIELMDYSFSDVYQAGPEEFINLIDNAELVCTDSFHACVFSLIFDKPFVVFDRDGTGAGMNSRIDTLLNKFDVEKKTQTSLLESTIFEYDYTEFNKRISDERKKSVYYLKKSLNIL